MNFYAVNNIIEIQYYKYTASSTYYKIHIFYGWQSPSNKRRVCISVSLQNLVYLNKEVKMRIGTFKEYL